MQPKTIAYIDGGNLYHGLLRGLPACKWLDIVALVNAMLVYSHLDANHDLVAVKYFTSRTKTYPHDPASIERQNIYLQALVAHDGLDVIEGYYNKNKAWVPSVNSRCQECTASVNGFVHVIKIEEKRTDVLPAKCQLTEVIPVGMHGRTIHRPAAWAVPATA